MTGCSARLPVSTPDLPAAAAAEAPELLSAVLSRSDLEAAAAT